MWSRKWGHGCSLNEKGHKKAKTTKKGKIIQKSGNVYQISLKRCLDSDLRNVVWGTFFSGLTTSV